MLQRLLLLEGPYETERKLYSDYTPKNVRLEPMYRRGGYANLELETGQEECMPFRFNFLMIVVPHTSSRSFETLMLCLKKPPFNEIIT
jgi:hypothetical protein